jgi:hypothetical protein
MSLRCGFGTRKRLSVSSESYCGSLILGFRVLDLMSGDQGTDQRAEQRFAAPAGVVDELEECGMDNVANHRPWAVLAGKGGVRLPSA